MSTTQQPEALVFANDRPSAIDDDLYQWAIDAEDLIRRQYARITDLEAQLSAIGAGGVESLSELVRMPNAEYLADVHAAVRHLRAIAAQAKQGAKK